MRDIVEVTENVYNMRVSVKEKKIKPEKLLNRDLAKVL